MWRVSCLFLQGPFHHPCTQGGSHEEEMHAFGYDDDGDDEAENNTDVDDKRFKLTQIIIQET